MAKVGILGQGIRRIAAILEALGHGPPSGLRLTDVAEEARLNKSTAYRLLTGLMEVGFVEQEPSSGLFRLSFAMFVLGSAALNRYGLSEIARAHLVRLESLSRDTVYVTMKSGFDSVCVARHEGSYPVKVLTLNVGDRRPLGVGGGALALLSFLPDLEIDAAMEANAERLAPYHVDVGKLRGLVETSRRQGFAFFDGLVVPEMAGMGLPIRGQNGRIIAALAVAALRERMQGQRRAELVEWLRVEAKALEAKLMGLTSESIEAQVEPAKQRIAGEPTLSRSKQRVRESSVRRHGTTMANRIPPRR